MSWARLESGWAVIEAHRMEIAGELDLLASELPGNDSRAVSRLANWFRTQRGYEQAVRRPDVLAICNPIMEAQADDGSITATDLKRCVGLGYANVSRSLVNTGRLLAVFLYPAIVLLAAFGLAVFFSEFIAPQFQEMFDEFGIQLPTITELTLFTAQLIKNTWRFAVGLLVLLVVYVTVMNGMTQQHCPAGTSWFEQQLMSRRSAAAAWAWHAAMLLEAGFDSAKAVEIAAESQPSPWVRRASASWVHVMGRRLPLKTTIHKLGSAPAIN